MKVFSFGMFYLVLNEREFVQGKSFSLLVRKVGASFSIRIMRAHY